jgi:outer membrane biosynthesis protein TonB
VSTILKALRRLEHEKAAPAGQRPLREEVTEPAAVTRRSRGAWSTAIVALGVGGALGAALLFLWSGGVTEDGDGDANVAIAAPPGSVSEPAAQPPREPTGAPIARRATPAPRPEATPEGLSADALASPVAVVARPEPVPLVVDEPVPQPQPAPVVAAASSAAPAPRPEPRASAPPAPVASGPSPAADVAEVPAEPVPAAAPSAESAGDEASSMEEDAPTPAEPAATPSAWSATEVRVERTLWHPQAERRVAVLALPGREDPLRVHEGDVVGTLVVVEIEPSGVVFTRDGERTRRALGE